jgi:N-acetylmuramoyl-L-alanine amidase
MSGTHIVQEGEHLSSIAKRFGFRNFETIWEHPNNAELRQLREDAHVLNPGDALFIPDRELKKEQRPTGKAHIFQIDESPLFLRLVNCSPTIPANWPSRSHPRRRRDRRHRPSRT